MANNGTDGFHPLTRTLSSNEPPPKRLRVGDAIDEGKTTDELEEGEIPGELKEGDIPDDLEEGEIQGELRRI